MKHVTKTMTGRHKNQDEKRGFGCAHVPKFMTSLIYHCTGAKEGKVMADLSDGGKVGSVGVFLLGTDKSQINSRQQ